MGGHPHDPREATPAAIGWLTVSDTRTEADDHSGALARKLIEAEGHRLVQRALVRDEPDEVRDQVRSWLESPQVEVILVSGGTGVSRRDRTYEALERTFERRLDGFGELFRMLSFDQVGSKSMLSRAVAGIASGKPLFLMPGSSKAVELALTRLILPEIPHLLAELRK